MRSNLFNALRQDLGLLLSSVRLPTSMLFRRALEAAVAVTFVWLIL